MYTSVLKSSSNPLITNEKTSFKINPIKMKGFNLK